MANNKIIFIGKTNFRNKDVKFGMRPEDRRRHTYIVGKTGMGKTTLLENMVISDILAGSGLAVVDPHGDFAEKILDYIPQNRVDDVIYFNPSDINYPIAFNPLEQVSSEFRHLVASSIMGVFKKIWVDLWSARMEYILNNALLALLEYPGSNLLGIMRLLSDKDYRKKVVDNLKDPVVKSFWVNEFARYSQKFETEATAAILNKVGQFVTNPLIRNILGQSRSTINMRKLMDDGKILVVNLSKGKIGEDNSALLGALIITKLQLAAMSRVDIPEEKRKDFYLYVDEFQNFATDSFANILSEARKYRLCLILAHQYIRQLVHDTNTKVRDAVFGNVGTIITFRVGAEDAEFLEKEFMPDFEAVDLVNLTKYTTYMKLMIDGVASRPFSARTLEPYVKPADSFMDVIIANTQNSYGTPRELVEKKIAGEWLAAPTEMGGERATRRDEQPLGRMLGPEGRSFRQFPRRQPAFGSEKPMYERPMSEKPMPEIREQFTSPPRPPQLRVESLRAAEGPASTRLGETGEPRQGREKPTANIDDLRKALDAALHKNQAEEEDIGGEE